MPNDPMELLRDEHDVIRTAQEVIDGMDRLWTKDEERYEEIFRGLLAFFAGYSDGFHHRKEELELFPALKSHPDFYPAGLVDELEEHHRMFRDHVARMQAALLERNYEAGQARLGRYFDELLDHMAVENDELFVMAESLFKEAELERMFFRFQDIDREKGDKNELEAGMAKLKAML